MSLQAKLDELRRQSEEKTPPEVLEIMHRATTDLETSGILDGVTKVGDPMPSFSLPDSNGETVALTSLAAGGPVAVTFYRGVW